MWNAAGGVDRLAAVGRHLHVHAAEVDDVGVVRVDAHLTEIHRPRVVVVDFLPRRPRIVGIGRDRFGIVVQRRPASASAALRSRRRAWRFFGRRAARRTRAAAACRRGRRPFDQRVEDAGALAVHVDADAAERTVGNAGLQSRPRFSGVSRFPETAAGAAAVHAAHGAPALIHRRVENPVVRRIHHEIVGSGVVVNLQDLLPGLAAVDRLVHAALAAGTPEAARGGDEDNVVVARIDHDAVDVP